MADTKTLEQWLEDSGLQDTEDLASHMQDYEFEKVDAVVRRAKTDTGISPKHWESSKQYEVGGQSVTPDLLAFGKDLAEALGTSVDRIRWHYKEVGDDRPRYYQVDEDRHIGYDE